MLSDITEDNRFHHPIAVTKPNTHPSESQNENRDLLQD